MRQISLFDGKHQFKITKPIRLIELFAGIGSQAKALRNLGANFEHYRICEFDKYAVQSYNEIHGTSFETSDITKIKAADLGITETDKYEYIMTYSFPCQDLSIAGKQKGMAKGSGTRSGLLWEVERLLNEMTELPQILLMENVPQVHGKKNIDSFREWQQFLESKGYKNYWQDLNAKNYGIPQNRNRTFMASLLGDYYYEFPGKIPLELRLKDMLESNVDEKYYIKNTKVNTLLKGLDYENANKVCCDMTINQPRFRDIANTIKARYDCGIENQRQTGTAVIEPKCEVVATLDIPGRLESACRVHGIDGIAPACNTCCGGGHETKIAEPIIVDDLYNNREPREYRDTAPTLRIGSGRLKVVEPIPKERFLRQAIETANENECNSVSLEQSNIKNINSENGLFTTLGTNCGSSTSSGGGVAFTNDLRIRKLTPKECWRLMGFNDEDFDKAKASGVSNSQLYKQAGNSIVVPVLEAIFRNLF